MDLVRKILISIENGDLHGGVEGYDLDTVNYHKALLVDADLVEGTPRYSSSGVKPSDIPTGVKIKRLKSAGHDFLEAIRADTKWNKVKAFLADAGKDLTIDVSGYAI